MAVRPGITVGHQPEKETVWQEHLKKNRQEEDPCLNPVPTLPSFSYTIKKSPLLLLVDFSWVFWSFQLKASLVLPNELRSIVRDGNVTRETLVLLADTVQNYRSASLLACKQSLLVLSSNGRAKAQVTRGWIVRCWVAKGTPCVAKRAKRRELVLCSEDLYG